MLAGNTAYTIPTSFESIATVSLGTGQTASSLEFTSIPQTFTHLQIRGIGRAGRNQENDGMSIRFNGVNTGNPYSSRYTRGNGSNVTANDYTLVSSNEMTCGDTVTAATASSNAMGMFIIDILDYCNTSKFKTLRHVGGYCLSSTGRISISSGNWRSTNAITSIVLFPNLSFQQYTHIALYGIKSA